jgi:NADH-quinone oxidoreductase subunit L
MDNMLIKYSILILFLPLLAFIIQIFFGKKLPRQGDWVSIFAIVTTLVLALIMFVNMIIEYNPNLRMKLLSHG